jgi:amino-acid N-acetyltransferase
MNIRKAVIRDIKSIHGILNYYSDQGLLLPRSLSELYDHLRDYFVLNVERPAGRTSMPQKLEPSAKGKGDSKSSARLKRTGGWDGIYGVCGLGICWEDLAEIRSLAVSEDAQNKGFGSQLVAACLDEAKSLGLSRVFALTYVPGFFKRFGFTEVDKGVLPHKVWADCLRCHKFPNCDETALLMEL